MATKVRSRASKGKTFTDEEKSAMQARVRELQSAPADGESEVLAKIDSMQAPDRAMAKRLHALIKASVPAFSSRTYYGMPAYAIDGKVVCWYKAAEKFKTRYATIGFSDAARLDDGKLWPTEYAVTELNAATEAKISALVKKAAG
ncbi:MAG TPA: DUF1801 domain-containing protein [Candidatus Dormibacteraeota bacterium]|nr:DUF1801 domain-containing protein [Candidatus Dormibacteraeota bacterium]